jgi:hypothetical protein
MISIGPARYAGPGVTSALPGMIGGLRRSQFTAAWIRGHHTAEPLTRERAPLRLERRPVFFDPGPASRRYPSRDSYSPLSLATTLGSASVVVSPRARPSAMSLRRRRMILPERVLGR